MGTNFYAMNGEHIGKRSAAGLYCWDCNITLCIDGENGVHESRSKWSDSCPSCGKKYVEESLSDGAAGRELGFNKKPFKKKTGVASCSSFSWAVQPDFIETKRKIKDEYGRIFTLKKFKQILWECPIQYRHSIGVEFC